jgi:hypothetical protein
MMILSCILVARNEYRLSGLFEVIFIFRSTSLLESNIKLSWPVGLSVLLLKEMVVRITVEHRLYTRSMFLRNDSVRLKGHEVKTHETKIKIEFLCSS